MEQSQNKVKFRFSPLKLMRALVSIFLCMALVVPSMPPLEVFGEDTQVYTLADGEKLTLIENAVAKYAATTCSQYPTKDATSYSDRILDTIKGSTASSSSKGCVRSSIEAGGGTKSILNWGAVDFNHQKNAGIVFYNVRLTLKKDTVVKFKASASGLSNDTYTLKAGLKTESGVTTSGTIKRGSSFPISGEVAFTIGADGDYCPYVYTTVDDNGERKTTFHEFSIEIVSGSSVTLYSITPETSDSAKGTVSGGGSIVDGNEASVTATPLTGYEFTGWYTASSGGTCISTSNPYKFTVTEDKTLYAQFKAKSYTITVNAGSGGTASGGGTKAYNTSVSLTATPSTGYAFKGWYSAANGGGTCYSTANPYTPTVKGNATYYAYFEANKYSVKCIDYIKNDSAYPGHGNMLGTKTGDYAFGSVVSGTAFGSSTVVGAYYTGYKFDSASSATVTKDGATVERYFVPTKYTITREDRVGSQSGILIGSAATADYYHGATASGADWGTSIEYGAYHTGYRYTGSSAPITVNGAATVYRYFLPASSALTVNPNGGTWVYGSTTYTAEAATISGDYSDSITIPLPTKKGCIFDGWEVTGTLNGTLSSLSTAGTYAFGPQSNINDTITATWRTAPPAFKANGDLESTLALTEGDALVLTINPVDDTYQQIKWESSTDGENFSTIATYTAETGVISPVDAGVTALGTSFVISSMPYDKGNNEITYRATLINAELSLSTQCKVTVSEATPAISSQPEDASILDGQTFVMSVGCSFAKTYTWQKLEKGSSEWVTLTDDENNKGTATAVFKRLRTPLSEDGTKYRCILQNVDKTTTTRTCLLTVVAADFDYVEADYSYDAADFGSTIGVSEVFAICHYTNNTVTISRGGQNLHFYSGTEENPVISDTYTFDTLGMVDVPVAYGEEGNYHFASFAVNVKDMSGPTISSVNIRWEDGEMYSASAPSNDRARKLVVAVTASDLCSSELTYKWSENADMSSPYEFSGAVYERSGTEGNITVYVRAYDEAGNASPVRSIVLNGWDVNRPVISETADFSPNTAYASSIQMTVFADDDIALAARPYAFTMQDISDETPDDELNSMLIWQYSNSYWIQQNGTYYVYARDKAGNVSAKQAFVIGNIDNDLPVLNGYDKLTDAETKTVFIRVNATDATSLLTYGYDMGGEKGVKWQKSNTFAISGEDDSRDLGARFFFVKDEAGNMQQLIVYESGLYVDGESILDDISSTKYQTPDRNDGGEVVWASAGNGVKLGFELSGLSDEDKQLVCKTYKWSSEPYDSEKMYTNVAENGIYTAEVYLKSPGTELKGDSLGLISYSVSNIDGTAPVVSAAEGHGVLNISVSDIQSGIADISIIGGEYIEETYLFNVTEPASAHTASGEVSYARSISAVMNGTYVITAHDAVGNETVYRVSVTGNPSITGSDIDMGGDVTTYSVNVFTDGAGTAFASESSVSAGKRVYLSYTETDGYEFSGWESDDVVVSGNSFIMPSHDVSVTAVFVEEGLAHSVTVISGGHGSASVLFKTEFKRDEHVYLTYLADDGYHFAGWECSDLDVERYGFVMPDRDVTVTAVFEADDEEAFIQRERYVLTVGSASHGEAWAPFGTLYHVDDTVCLTVKPDDGYVFDHWNVVAGGIELTDFFFKMPEGNVEICPVFIAASSGASVSKNGIDTNGNEQPDTNLDIDGDGKADVNLAEDDGEGYPAWDDADKHGNPTNYDADGDGEPDLNIDTDGDEWPDENIDLDGDGIPDMNAVYHSVDVSDDGHGVGAVCGPAERTFGETVRLMYLARPGYEFNKWRSNDVSVSGGTFKMPAKNVSVVAVFKDSSVAARDVDTNGNEQPDTNLDIDGDGRADVNLAEDDGEGYPAWDDADKHGNPTNYDADGDGEPDLNIDTDGDEWPDENIDLDGDGIPDMNPRRYMVSVTHTTGGQTAAGGSTSYYAGETVRLLQLASDGYVFSEWESDDAEIRDNAFVMPFHDVSVRGIFTSGAIDHSVHEVTAIGREHGRAAVLGNTKAHTGDRVSLVAIPDVGFVFAGWESDDVTVDGSGTFIMPAGDVTIYADFIADDTYIGGDLSAYTRSNVILRAAVPEDALSQLVDQPYSWDGGQTWSSDDSFEAASNGTYSVLIKLRDGSVIGPVTKVVLNIDREAPSLTAAAYMESLSISADDAKAGVSVVRVTGPSGCTLKMYKTEGGELSLVDYDSSACMQDDGSFQAQIIVDKLGEYHVTASDLLGNEVTRTVVVTSLSSMNPATIVGALGITHEPDGVTQFAKDKAVIRLTYNKTIASALADAPWQWVPSGRTPSDEEYTDSKETVVHDNGAYTLYIRLVDGSVIAGPSVTVTGIDRDAPAVSASAYSNALSLTVSDEKAGVRTVYISGPDGSTLTSADDEAKVYTLPCAVPLGDMDADGKIFRTQLLADTTGDYVIKVTDQLGNKDTRTVSVSRIPAMDASALLAAITAWTEPEASYVKDFAMLKAVCSDDAAAYLSDRPWQWVPAGSVPAEGGFLASADAKALENGNYTVYVRLVDDTVVTGPSVTVSSIDRVAPVVSISMSTRGLVIEAEDAKSGLDEVKLYNITNGEINEIQYTGSSQAAGGLREDGTFYLEYELSDVGDYKVVATDKLGNSAEKTKHVNVSVIGIETPEPVTGIANGSSMTYILEHLPDEVAAKTAMGGRLVVPVTWNTDDFLYGTSYSQASPDRQTFVLSGTAQIPSYVDCPDGLSMTQISVTVEPAQEGKHKFVEQYSYPDGSCGAKTGEGAVANEEYAVITVKNKAIRYTGSVIKPKLDIVYKYYPFTDNGRVSTQKTLKLKENRDYYVTCVDNVEAGTATMTLVGMGDFTGAITREFVIGRSDISKAKADKLPDMAYTGADLSEEIKSATKLWYKKTLIDPSEYELEFAETPVGSADADTRVKFIVRANDINFTGQMKKELTVVIAAGGKQDISADGAVVLKQDKNYVYTGKAVRPKVTVTFGDKKLKASDYTLVYENNVNAGMGSVYAVGKGAYCGRTPVCQFVIQPQVMEKVKVSALTKIGFRVSIDDLMPVLSYGGKKLVRGAHYTVAYEDISDWTMFGLRIKKAQLTFTAIDSNFTGEKVVTVGVTPRSIKSRLTTEIIVDEGVLKDQYDSAQPTVMVKYNGALLRAGTDYSVTYKKNTKPGKMGVAIIRGTGNYTGKRTVYFHIRNEYVEPGSIRK